MRVWRPFFWLTLLMPFQASALIVRQYESETREQRSEDVAQAIDKIVADVAKVNPALSKAIHDYFWFIPNGQPESPGLMAFARELGAVENLADKGKMDLDKMQIEGILLDIIKTDLDAPTGLEQPRRPRPRSSSAAINNSVRHPKGQADPGLLPRGNRGNFTACPHLRNELDLSG